MAIHYLKKSTLKIITFLLLNLILEDSQKWKEEN